MLRSCCSPAIREDSHRASHGSDESCAGGRICLTKPENSRGIVGGFHNSRTGSEFRFLITRYTTTASCCSWNGISIGSKRTEGGSKIRPVPLFLSNIPHFLVSVDGSANKFFGSGNLSRS